jgi:hypothetical protein
MRRFLSLVSTSTDLPLYTLQTNFSQQLQSMANLNSENDTEIRAQLDQQHLIHQEIIMHYGV